ncbi:alpha 1,3-glucosidase [Galdieria sulphuraria]|uniref:Glucosidase II subunit alpha n=1 Tax=Galdieria sulphuraria TaxID=130081 RepID=M2X6J7_GALSU|nr:alpha 1,3-glucosidase [Galdieria sulphuraria]EME32140.1 alpha 1,3-glucosidase [Galdieria sulphuraria]|eukprot:XP_005708660.1 alpha 1,3-glucosidase [Galdieria sulphuraria]
MRIIPSKVAIIIIIFFLLYIVSRCSGAKWADLCKCEELSFCRRNRVTDQTPLEGNLLFPETRVREGSVKAQQVKVKGVVGDSLYAILESRVGNVSTDLVLQVFPLTGGSFRITIAEEQAPLLRFDAKDALKEPFPLGHFDLSPYHDVEATLLWNEGKKLILKYVPFELLVFSNNQSLYPDIVVNHHRLTKLEVLQNHSNHFCAALEETHLANDNISIVENMSTNTKEDSLLQLYCQNAFEETVHGHLDQKKRGLEAVSMDIMFPFGQHLYGLAERATDLSLSFTKDSLYGSVYSEPYRFYNLDVFEYETQKPLGLYGSIPVLYTLEEKSTSGCLWLNAAETFVDIFPSNWSQESSLASHFISETGLLDVVLFPGGKTPQDVFNQYLLVTGRPAMTQRFALGYHQSRWNYRDQMDTLAVNQRFDQFNIPCDVIWLDIEHTNGKRYFTWDMEKFPDPSSLLKRIGDNGRKLVTIVDPHIKVDNDYFVYREAKANQFFIRKQNEEEEYSGWCWAGLSSYLDFVSKKVRNWWSTRFQFRYYPHFGDNLYTWIDMNEPTVFDGPENTIPKSVIHLDGWEHRQVHNMYGFYMHKATYDGLLQSRNFSDRPFVLSRSFFAGSHRYGAVWTGDNQANWEHLRYSIPMILSLQISGMILSGADVGGFFFDPDPELLIRWYEVAAFQPFFRAHAHEDTRRREPWEFDAQTTTLIRKAILRRYELLPYWYTLFAASSSVNCEADFETCGPPMRPMFWEFSYDKETWKEQTEWMIGNALLVAPILEKDSLFRTVYLPPGNVSHQEQWFDLFSTDSKKRSIAQRGFVQVNAPLGRHIVFQRGGTIVPFRNRTRRSTVCMERDPIGLRIALDHDGKAKGLIYLDDGRSFLYESGHFRLAKYLWNSTGTLQVMIHPLGNKPFVGSDIIIEQIVVYGMKQQPKRAYVSSQLNNATLHFSST